MGLHLVDIVKEVSREKVTFDILHTLATRNVAKADKAAGVPRTVYVTVNGASEQARRVIKSQNGGPKKPYASQEWRGTSFALIRTVSPVIGIFLV